jgi:hypothetical protein
MHHRRRFWPSSRAGALGLCSCLAFGLFLACSDDDTDTTKSTKPEGPPEIEILDLTTEDGVRHSNFDEALDLGCSRTVVVRVGPNPSAGKLKNFTLLPARGCGAIAQCGHVRVSASAADASPVEAFGAATNLELDLSTVAPEGAFVAGEYEIVAELLGDDGSPFELEEETFSDRVSVTLSASCDISASGGAGGETSQGGAGGSSSGGAGGSSTELSGGAGGMGGSEESGGSSAGGSAAGGAGAPGGSGGAGGAN